MQRINIAAPQFEYDPQDPEGYRSGRFRLGPIEILVTNTGGPPASAAPLAQSVEEREAAYRTLWRQWCVGK